MREQICDRKKSDQIGWVENGRDVYSVKSQEIFARSAKMETYTDGTGSFSTCILNPWTAARNSQARTLSHLIISEG